MSRQVAETEERQEDMPTSPEALLARMEETGVAFTRHEHAPIFTVAEGAHLKASIPGVHCRNLFLRDKKEKMFLVVAANETKIDLKKLQGLLRCDRLSFGSPDRLWRYLGVRPGSVCPFAIINDTEQAVEIHLDKSMMAAERVNYHPLINSMTVGLTPAGLLRFIEFCGHTPHIIDLASAAPDE